MTVSIIIAVKICTKNLKECVSRCLELDYKDYEIIILPDNSFPAEGLFSHPNIRIIPTESVTPPYKRDIGAKFARAEVLAFLDDDAYPAKYWLKEAIRIFKESKDIGCVCGPAITPKADSIRQIASGLVYSSIFISGNHIFRYIPKKRREVLDFPSCNFLIKKDLFDAIDGFNKPYWPGEDTFLCLKVLGTDKKMIYDPKVLVFHHRRKLFKGHIRQIKNYALHRGYFSKKYPQNSRSIEYFIPSFFVLGLMLGFTLSFFSLIIKAIYLFSVSIYLVLIGLNSLMLFTDVEGDTFYKIKLFGFVISGIILTHITYGFYFVKGLFVKRMPEE